VKLAGTLTLPASPEEVWALLTDASRLAPLLPGCERLEPDGPDRYKAAVKFGIAAISGKYAGTLEFAEKKPSHSLVLKMDGKGLPGFVKGEGKVQLSPKDSGTLLQYSGDVSAGGATSLVLHRFGDVLGGIARAGQTGSLSGAYGFQLDYSPFPAGTVGVMNFDGAGNVAVSVTSAGGIDSSQRPVSSALNGTYSIKSDGTGTINLKPAAGQSANLTFAFVTTDGGSGLLLLQTSLAARGDVAFGTGRLQ